MHLSFRTYYSALLSFEEEELEYLSRYIETIKFKRGQMILREGQICDFVMFVNEGIVRHYFHDDNGNDVTCDISMEDDFYTDTQSMETGLPAKINSQAITDVSVSVMKQSDMAMLLGSNVKYQKANQIIMNRVSQRLTNHLLMLSEDRPEIRYKILLNKNPEFIKRVPLRYIAGYLRITPESLSRIRKRISLKS